MKHIASLSLALAMALSGAPAWADSHTQQVVHHPVGSASAPMAKAMPGKSNPAMASTDAQMKAMQQMYDKMMAAKTPEERNALMADHMKTMQDGMGGMQGDAGTRSQMMEKRMEMTESMMQITMDRLPVAPEK